MQIYVHTCMNDHKSGFRKRCVRAMPPCIFLQTVRLPTRHKKCTLTIQSAKILLQTYSSLQAGNRLNITLKEFIHPTMRIVIYSPSTCSNLVWLLSAKHVFWKSMAPKAAFDTIDFHCMHNKILRRIPKFVPQKIISRFWNNMKVSKWEFYFLDDLSL